MADIIDLAHCITTTQAASRLGISRARVGQFIRTGRLRAMRLGRDWRIEPQALCTVIDRPGPGWKKGRKRGVRDGRQ